jgi:hypothetical protein
MVKKSPKRKVKKGAWFIKVRGSYLPASPAGWLTYIPYVIYLLCTFIIGWQEAPTRGLAFLFIAPNWVVAAVIMTWVASAKS